MKKKRKVMVSILAGVMAAIMLLTLVLSLVPVRARAVSSSEIQEQIDELEKKQEEMEAEMAALEEQMQQNQNETAGIVTQKSNIDQQIALMMAKISNINEQIDAYNVLIADKQEDLDLAQKRLEDLNEKNRDRIRAMEEDGGLSYWSVIFKASSFSDLLDRLNMIEEIAAADRRRIQEMSDAAKEVEAAQQVLTEEKAGLEVSKLELEAAQKDLEAKRAESNKLLQELVAEAELLDNNFFDYEQKTAELLEELGKAQQEYEDAKYQEWLATSQPSYDNDSNGGGDDGDYDSSWDAPSSGADWIIPCDYVYLSSAYGWREPPTEGASDFHGGVDLAGYEGAPIWATRGGTVYRAGYSEYNGYYVGVDHGDGFASVYLHLTDYVVDIGDYVSQGEVVGFMGSTGVSTGPHLHLTIYYNGDTVNPAEYIDFY